MKIYKTNGDLLGDFDLQKMNYAQMNYAQMNDAQMNDAKMNYAQMNGAQMNYAQMNGAQMNYAQMNDAQMNDAQMNGAQMNNAQMNYAQMNDAQMNGAQMNNAQMNYAQMNNAELKNVVFDFVSITYRCGFGFFSTNKKLLQQLFAHPLSVLNETLKKHPEWLIEDGLKIEKMIELHNLLSDFCSGWHQEESFGKIEKILIKKEDVEMVKKAVKKAAGKKTTKPAAVKSKKAAK